MPTDQLDQKHTDDTDDKVPAEKKSRIEPRVVSPPEQPQLLAECPHCQVPFLVYVREIKCQRFRHAVYKDTYEPINPHMKDAEAANLVHNNAVYGCGKFFYFDGKALRAGVNPDGNA